MIEKYTPLMRERKANQPNTKATSPGSATTRNSAHSRESEPAQYQGNSFQSRKTMKSGSSAP